MAGTATQEGIVPPGIFDNQETTMTETKISKKVLWRPSDTNTNSESIGVAIVYPDGVRIEYDMPGAMPANAKMLELLARGWYEKAKDSWAGKDSYGWPEKRALVEKAHQNWLAGTRTRSSTINVQALVDSILALDSSIDEQKIRDVVSDWKQKDLNAFFSAQPEVEREYITRTAAPPTVKLADMF